MQMDSSIFKYWLSKQTLTQVIQVIQIIRALAEGIPGDFGYQLKETEWDTQSGSKCTNTV